MDNKVKLTDDMIVSGLYDLFWGVIPDFRSCTSIWAYVYTHEILLKDDLHGIWEKDVKLVFNDIV